MVDVKEISPNMIAILIITAIIIIILILGGVYVLDHGLAKLPIKNIIR